METGFQKIEANLKTDRHTVKSWLIFALVLFVIALLSNLFIYGGGSSNSIGMPNGNSWLVALSAGVRILIIYLGLSLIPVPWITKALCFISTALVLSGFAGTIMGFSFPNLGGFLIWVGFRINYAWLIFMLATIAVQTINNRKYQSTGNYLGDWFSALKGGLTDHWVPTVISMGIYVVLMAITSVAIN
ncbi:hypothetical protein [Lactobacillus sp. Sy-1]|uniref:hypothetical protein n=1 Tax=Lactobacillus sp. Sy-1 TaxID=2109645 RepID=UPI001C5B29D1|nr:hypothetical protein [Lactobacillus sp. Sy-1]MBW1605950.1 hypothetical protein [Lactobacillus sp. Sy-1]